MRPRRETLETALRLREAFGTSAFEPAAAVSIGLSGRQLEQAVRSGTIVRLRKGLYSVSGDPVDRHLGLLHATTQRLRDGGFDPIVFGRSAAIVTGMGYVSPRVEPTVPPATLAVPTVCSTRAGRRSGVSVRKIDIPPAHIVDRSDGLRMTTPLRTGVDLACEFRVSPRHALGALCLAVRSDMLSGLSSGEARQIDRLMTNVDAINAKHEELSRTWSQARLRGALALSGLLGRVNPAPENPFEALSWAGFSLSGLPQPECQQWVQGASGRWYRVDFLWRDARLIGEADGAVKYRSAADVIAEKQRQADLEAAGYRLIRWTWQDVVPDAQQLIGRVDCALSERMHARHVAAAVGQDRRHRVRVAPGVDN
ncbi:MAG: DUF559 domain-containing protein [Actinomycetota bacterium]